MIQFKWTSWENASEKSLNMSKASRLNGRKNWLKIAKIAQTRIASSSSRQGFQEGRRGTNISFKKPHFNMYVKHTWDLLYFNKQHVRWIDLNSMFLWPVKIIVTAWTIIYRRFSYKIIIIFSASFGCSLQPVRKFVHFRFENHDV